MKYHGVLTIAYLYQEFHNAYSVNKVNAIKKLIRVSTPGLRKYTGYKDMPRVINGLRQLIIFYLLGGRKMAVTIHQLTIYLDGGAVLLIGIFLLIFILLARRY